ncbi:hypothetical protein [Streptomyces sp. NPDC002692]
MPAQDRERAVSAASGAAPVPVRDHAIIEWLARSAADRNRARVEWDGHGITVLAMGERLAAVRMSGELVHAACATDDPEQVAATLAELLDGPVIRDRQTPADVTYFALVSPHAGLVRDYPRHAVYLATGVYLGVPAPHHVTPPGAYWAPPPRYEGDLCAPQGVEELVRTGARRLRECENAGSAQ